MANACRILYGRDVLHGRSGPANGTEAEKTQKLKESTVLEFQGLLFGDDVEARAQEAARLSALEQQRAYTEARKLAWERGKPFPEDEAKYHASEMVKLDAAYLKPFWERKETEPYCPDANAIAKAHISFLESGACSRAKQLGSRIGRRGPILEVYKRAVRSPVLLCYWCKALTFPGGRQVDHIQPLAAGGAHVSGNLCISCVECNISKGDRSPVEFRKVIAEKRNANSPIAADYFRRLASSPNGT